MASLLLVLSMYGIEKKIYIARCTIYKGEAFMASPPFF